jgi:hypothetical protein
VSRCAEGVTGTSSPPGQRLAPEPRLVAWPPDEPDELRAPPLEPEERLGDGELEREPLDELGARTLGALREPDPGLIVPRDGEERGATICRLGRSGEVLGTITGRDPVTGLEDLLLPRVEGITLRDPGVVVLAPDDGLLRRTVGGTTVVRPPFWVVPGEVLTVLRLEGEVDGAGRDPLHRPPSRVGIRSEPRFERWMLGRVCRPASAGVVPAVAGAVRTPALAGDLRVLGRGESLEVSRPGVLGLTSCRARVGARSPSRARTGVRSVAGLRSARSNARSRATCGF